MTPQPIARRLALTSTNKIIYSPCMGWINLLYISKSCHPIILWTLRETRRQRQLDRWQKKMLKVAPFGFTIASALRTKAQVICARLKENVSVLGYFITSSSAQKQKTKTQKKLTVNFLAFPWVKFHKIWQVGNKHFTLVEARFSEKSIRPVLFQRRKT